MKTNSWLRVAAGLALAAGLGACYRPTERVRTIPVPDMDSPVAERIVANALLYQATYQPGLNIQLFLESMLHFDRAAQALYLRMDNPSPNLQAELRAALESVGIEVRSVERIWVQPSNPDYGGYPVLRIAGPGLNSNTAANRAAAALARALDRDPAAGADRVAVNSAARTVTVRYDPLRVAAHNLEIAVARCGYRCGTPPDEIPACLGRPDADPYGWTPGGREFNP